jgi:hypothetical protein
MPRLPILVVKKDVENLNANFFSPLIYFMLIESAAKRQLAYGLGKSLYSALSDWFQLGASSKVVEK